MLAALALRLARLPLQAAGSDDSYFLLDYLLTDFGLWRPLSKGLPRQEAALSLPEAFALRTSQRARQQGRPSKEEVAPSSGGSSLLSVYLGWCYALR